MKNKTKRISFDVFIKYISVFLLIFLSSGFVLSKYSGATRLVFFVIFGLILAIGCIIKHISIEMSIPFLASIAICLLSYLTNGDELNTTIVLLVYYIVTFIFCNFIKINEWFEIYAKVIFFLCIMSLILYFLAIFFPSIYQKLPSVSNSLGYTSKTIFFANYSGEYRNSGIVWEPGAFQTYIVIALILEWFVFKLSHKVRTFVILLTLITTFSTAGFISLTVFFICGLLDALTNRNKGKNKIMFLLLTICLFLFAFLFISVLQPSLYQKVFGKIFSFAESRNNNSSVGTRYSAIIGGIEAFKNNPIIGCGNSGFRAFLLSEYNNSMPTCTFINWFGMFGFFYGVLMIASFVGFAGLFSKNTLVKIFLIVVLIITTASEDYTLNPSIMALSFYGWFELKKHKSLLINKQELCMQK